MGWKKHYFILRNVLQLVDAEAVRLWLLGTHYRAPLNFELAADDDTSPNPKARLPGIEEAERRMEYFYETKARLIAKVGRAASEPAPSPAEGSPLRALRDKFVEALDKDLNTAGALAPMGEIFKRANELVDSNRKDPVEARTLLGLFAYMGDTLGIAEGEPEVFFSRVHRRRVASRGIDPTEIDKLVVERNLARKSKDFTRADAIRNELLARGIEIRDVPGGESTWRAT
jgi:cysteinyl-tRNA synthetase